MDEEQEKKFIDECRSWLGTKWQHSVRLKGVAVDCVMFILSIAQYMGWVEKDYKVMPYPRDWALHQSRSKLMDFLKEYCEEISKHSLKIGDILVYKFSKCNSHVAFYIGNDMAIHSHIRFGVVEYNIYEPKFRKKLSCAMRWRGNK